MQRALAAAHHLVTAAEVQARHTAEAINPARNQATAQDQALLAKSKTSDDSSSSISLKKKPSEKASSSSSKKSSGTFSGATSKVSGKTYSGKTSKAYVGGGYVSVNHYYHAGFAPSGWFGYYSGFTMGMFMISMMHPWGYTYHPVGGPGYVSYGASPIAWIVDIIALIIILIIVIALIRAFKAPKTYRRRF